MTDDGADRRQAIDEVRADRARTLALLDEVAPEAFDATGLGGGEWSPKDLVGHLESWEQHALDAIAAWERGASAPIGVALDTLGTDEVNRREVERKGAAPAEEIRSSAATTHLALVEAMERATEEWWYASPDEDLERSHGQRIGGILGGERGLFRHDPDHWADLESFAVEHPSP
jgi:hypothetical protein